MLLPPFDSSEDSSEDESSSSEWQIARKGRRKRSKKRTKPNANTNKAGRYTSPETIVSKHTTNNINTTRTHTENMLTAIDTTNTELMNYINTKTNITKNNAQNSKTQQVLYRSCRPPTALYSDNMNDKLDINHNIDKNSNDKDNDNFVVNAVCENVNDVEDDAGDFACEADNDDENDNCDDDDANANDDDDD
uniref:Uncharacterized protein n=1 Tax=Octopus bimaculoides TaxID=37653 RepID=A0A0L8HCA7_OCTBM